MIVQPLRFAIRKSGTKNCYFYQCIISRNSSQASEDAFKYSSGNVSLFNFIYYIIFFIWHQIILFQKTDTFYAKCYQILELENNSSKDLVRHQYIKMAKIHHPDTIDEDPEGLEYQKKISKFYNIDRAYKELMQKFAEEKRKEEQCVGEYGLYYNE